MQLTPQKIAAIKALADDERGEPNTRAAAKAKLDQYRTQHPHLFIERDLYRASVTGLYQASSPNPRTQPSEDYSKWRFMDMGNWKLSNNGNHTIMVGSRRVTLFKRKSLSGWNWSIAMESEVVFSKTRMDTIREAQEEAWAFLTT